MLHLLSILLCPTLPADSLRSFNIEEAVVVASPKENTQLRRQPLSVSLLDAAQMQPRGIGSLKNISAYVPNFYMPEYGSRITSACYIRGIGSRINTPAVGLYVDNVPYADKSSYDFSFDGVERVDVMRGPQSTLYGRNTMGGLVRVFTADPLTHHGTDLSAGWTSRTAGRRASLTTYLHPAADMGISIGAYYNGENGFFCNSATGTKQDGEDAGGARLRWSWAATPVVKIDWTASYELSNEQACPYYLLQDLNSETATAEEQLAQNRPSSYRRSIFNTGLGVEHRLPHLVLTSTTSYQRLADKMFMDQDFTSADIFSLEQKQRMNVVTEEVALKSPAGKRRWQWSTGAFAMYQYLRTTCPVTFYADGVDYLNSQIASAMPTSPKIGITFTESTVPFTSRLVTPSVNAALFHQSTINDLGVKGLSLTLGLRLDYDYHELRLTSGLEGETSPFDFSMAMGPTMSFNSPLLADATLNGNLYNHSWQLLPKGSLNYELPRGLGNVYFSVAKGYRSGGYNIQSYSDLSQTALRRSMMQAVVKYSTETINSLPLPEAQKQGAIRGMTSVIEANMPAEPSIGTLYYKPEYTWSYELGTHLSPAGRALQIDLSAFWMKTRDQQLARFAQSGLGREMVNAGRSRSIGLEASLRSSLLSDRLMLSATYGFTNSTFTNYDLGTSTDGTTVDYTSNRVPYVPLHTFSASADYRQPVSSSWLKAVSFGADVKGAGNVMWDEANSFSQDFYANLGARIAFELPANVSIDIWGRNLTDSHYATFSFDSMNRRFAQFGAPRHFGVDVKVHF